ncbi:hypothetical protein [Actinocorallia sp. A-T 12471]|uniref:hypothetical protein n=1 Tax=Actinocorallia sp. A-T 12471 TaxID=3089813 RepID=UPI0029D135B7|nr:hypothetical protein [Actinocorallia sp. A-T 12471]MDX6740794.1 hypothetical protein [Actinocorallia sp. A-T 12471]
MADGERIENRVEAETVGTLVQFRDVYGGMHLHLPEERRERSLPRMLGARSLHYTDREDQLALLNAARERAVARNVPLVVVCVGPEGVGKTELVTEWLRRLAAEVPGPHLYADMGETGPATAKEALGRFLRLMGEAPEDLPDDLAGLTGLFRTRTHGVPSIVFLDNVALASQARPLLPEAPGSIMVVTSRGLDGVLRASVPLALGRMADAAVHELVAQVSGVDLTAEPRAGDLVAALAGNPSRAFAAGMQLALGQSVAGLVAELARRTHSAGADGSDVADLLESAYTKLDPEAARVYRSLSGLVGRRFGAETVRAAAGVQDGAALDALVAAGLVRREDTGFRLSLGVAAHLAELVPEPEREAALRRVLEGYLRASVRADYSAMPRRWWLGEHYDGYRGTEPPMTEHDAIAWLETELDVILAAAQAAADREWHGLVVRLAEAQWAVCLKRRPYDHWRALYTLGVRSAEELRREGRDVRFLGRMRCGLGFAHLLAGRVEDAAVEFAAAREADAAIGHVRGLATAVESLGLAHLARSGAELLPALVTLDDDAAAEALAAFEENLAVNLALPADLRDARAIALAHRHLGRALSATAAHGRAEEHLRIACDGFRALPDPYNLGKTLIDLGQARIRAGLLSEAAVVLREALELLRADESPAEVVRGLETVGALAERGGDVSGAVGWLSLALENLRFR